MDGHIVYSGASEFQIPLLAAFTRDFDPKLLDGYPGKNARSGGTRIFDRPDLLLGNAFVQGIRIPAEPPSLVVGYGEPLRVAFPLSGSLLFGTLKGSGEAAIAWRNGTACVNSSVEGALSDFQADALGLLVQGVTPPLIADRWNANFTAHTTDLCLDRARLRFCSAIRYRRTSSTYRPDIPPYARPAHRGGRHHATHLLGRPPARK